MVSLCFFVVMKVSRRENKRRKLGRSTCKADRSSKIRMKCRYVISKVYRIQCRWKHYKSRGSVKIRLATRHIQTRRQRIDNDHEAHSPSLTAVLLPPLALLNVSFNFGPDDAVGASGVPTPDTAAVDGPSAVVDPASSKSAK